MYFTEGEFKCSCGCGLDITDKAKQKITEAREIADTPFIITSGARCLNHNRSIGSKDNSAHVECVAYDIAFSGSGQKFKIISGLIKAGFKRIGINEKEKFIHADISKTLPNEVLFPY